MRCMPAPYSAKAVANFFLERRRKKLTQMKLHKLLYYSHGWHLGFRGKPLLDEMVEAWEYGPVVPSIYHEFKRFGSSPITRFAQELNPDTLELETPRIGDDSDVIGLLKRVWEVYGKFTAAQLSALTHAKESPWTQTRNKQPGIKGVDIPNDLIEKHFRDRLKKVRHAA